MKVLECSKCYEYIGVNLKGDFSNKTSSTAMGDDFDMTKKVEIERKGSVDFAA